ncbi:hypothetical protein Baya_7791 [Bagarius yarrelli]|uniref:Uncharacterized protein n=1 Tax=Bagarius yarrelli TaxID=175774 RepID=A0A556U2I6_BAGYA|nr:hypothetical protein Baya_7791 [Bagarius yarrelli]
MSSVNSAACLLARNHYYQSSSEQAPSRWILSLVLKSPLSSHTSSHRPRSADRMIKYTYKTQLKTSSNIP